MENWFEWIPAFAGMTEEDPRFVSVRSRLFDGQSVFPYQKAGNLKSLLQNFCSMRFGNTVSDLWWHTRFGREMFPL